MRILVVDDEKIILEILKEHLEMEGHIVVTAHNGRRALDLYLEAPDAFELILTDINMPIVNGIELAHRIRETRPFVPIIFISACIGKAATKDSTLLEPCKWLQKPFPLEKLDSLIHYFGESMSELPVATATL